MPSHLTCTRCHTPIAPEEPFADLECSHRTYEDPTAEDLEVVTLAAFGIATLCRDCGEHLQITSPDVPEGEKLCRVALVAPGVQAALSDLSPALALSPEPLVSRENQCQSCSAPLMVLDDPRWMECTLTYRTATLEAWGMTESVLDTYAVFCLCCECCKQLPFPMLEDMDKEGQALAYQWTAVVVWLLGAAGT